MITIDDEKIIRFIDSQYNDLFYIRDGENIILTRSDGEKSLHTCKFFDECHTMVSGRVYHICEFAEMMEKAGATYAPEKPASLPNKCFSTLPSNGELIIIEKNVDGYTKCGASKDSPDANKRYAKSQNRCMCVTAQQEAAMLGGSMFGWKTRAARPSSYNFYGVPINPAKNKGTKSKERER